MGHFWISGCKRLICLVLGMMLLGIPVNGAQPENPASAGKTKKEDVLNVLLIGQDKREGEQGNRSDSMILCSYNPETKRLTMVSFLRDLYVSIPGREKNRINAAYAYGGAQLLVKTLEHNFAIPIDGTVQVDFSDFAKILDLLGGVSLELREDEAGEINRLTGGTLTQGQQSLSGEEALAYTRIRSLDADGDFSRTDRQRKVLGAVWDRYRTSSLPTWVRTLGMLLPMVETDMGNGALLSAAVKVFPDLKEIEVVSHRIPEPGKCADKVVDGMAVLVADPVAVREALHNWIYGTT